MDTILWVLFGSGLIIIGLIGIIRNRLAGRRARIAREEQEAQNRAEAQKVLKNLEEADIRIKVDGQTITAKDFNTPKQSSGSHKIHLGGGRSTKKPNWDVDFEAVVIPTPEYDKPLSTWYDNRSAGDGGHIPHNTHDVSHNHTRHDTSHSHDYGHSHRHDPSPSPSPSHDYGSSHSSSDYGSSSSSDSSSSSSDGGGGGGGD